MSVDSIADFLTIIRNGLMITRRDVKAPYSNVKADIARILKSEGFINDYEIIDEGKGKKFLQIYLKYVDNESVIHEITRISKPGRRVYRNIAKIEPVIGGLGVGILSTNRGLMTDKQARAEKVGGELICEVW